jgi:phosphohistidine phosphatase
MEIYLLRHAIAEERRPGRSDEQRALTEEGRRKLRPVLDRARAAGAAPSVILSSPYVRAVATAEMAAEVLGCQAPVIRTNALTPDSSPDVVWREICDHRGERAILLAGHEPLLGEVAGYLLGCPELTIDFKKGALLRVDLEDSARRPHGTLQWLLTPKLAVGH